MTDPILSCPTPLLQVERNAAVSKYYSCRHPTLPVASPASPPFISWRRGRPRPHRRRLPRIHAVAAPPRWTTRPPASSVTARSSPAMTKEASPPLPTAPSLSPDRGGGRGGRSRRRHGLGRRQSLDLPCARCAYTRVAEGSWGRRQIVGSTSRRTTPRIPISLHRQSSRSTSSS